jgi:hypothetical protein
VRIAEGEAAMSAKGEWSGDKTRQDRTEQLKFRTYSDEVMQ